MLLCIYILIHVKDSMSFKTISDSRGLTLYTSTPQSKTGFAPFAIGFTIFSLSLIGGSSGGAFNPGRLFGPAVLSGKLVHLWLYFLAEILGASFAGLLVHNLHRFGLDTYHKLADVSVVDAVNSRSRSTSDSVASKSSNSKNSSGIQATTELSAFNNRNEYP